MAAGPDPTAAVSGVGGVPGTNWAVTVLAWIIVTTQVPRPEQPSPDQPEK